MSRLSAIQTHHCPIITQAGPVAQLNHYSTAAVGSADASSSSIDIASITAEQALSALKPLSSSYCAFVGLTLLFATPTTSPTVMQRALDHLAAPVPIACRRRQRCYSGRCKAADSSMPLTVQRCYSHCPSIAAFGHNHHAHLPIASRDSRRHAAVCVTLAGSLCVADWRLEDELASTLRR